MTEKLTPIEEAVRALAKLSDAEWMRVKCDEERRRAAGLPWSPVFA
jgi:hypothetical protein